jgi:drug/metabolite transporter (DMT)-like permease
VSGTVFVAVLLAALLHAAWNAIVKAAPNSYLDTVLVNIFGALTAVVALGFLPLPHAASVPFMIGSAIVHMGYFALVGAAYRHADLSYAYPLMRGTGPLLVSLTSAAFIGEALTGTGYLGVALICGGLLALAVDGMRRPGAPGTALGRGTLFSLANGVVIAAYTYLDGLGARASGAPVSYLLWMLLLTAVPLVGMAFRTHRAALPTYIRLRWRHGLIGGLCTLGAYGLALWAMTLAPIAIVAALRETSIVFATAIGGLLLGERVGVPRVLAVIVVVGGAAVLRLA